MREAEDSVVIERCAGCGRELEEYNAHHVSKERAGLSGYGGMCLECEQRYFDVLSDKFADNLALFYCCIAFDVPFMIEAVPAFEENMWITYIDNLRVKGLCEKSGEARGFLGGMTDITGIFGADLKSGEFAAAAKTSKRAKDLLAGTKLQRDTWGEGDKKHPYTTEDYKELDRLFNTFAARLKSSGGYDIQQEHILKLCAKMSFDMQRFLDAGLIDKAQKLNKMIQENLASENLRKKDEKPVEDLRLDSIVDSLEKAGLLKQGKILPLVDVQNALLDLLKRRKDGVSKRYPYTIDAADQMIQSIINAMRINDSLPEIGELPDNLRLDENVSCEFAQFQNADEENVYKELGLVRKRAASKDGGKGFDTKA